MLHDILVYALTIAGFIFLIRYTDGPKDIFYNFRIKIGVYSIVNDKGEDKDFIDDTFLAKLFACHWCLATWLALFLSICMQGINFTLYWFATVFVTGVLLEILLFIRKYNG